MVKNTQNSFEMYIGIFTFYIIFINYTTFMGQILIFGFNRIQNTIIPTISYQTNRKHGTPNRLLKMG